MDMLRKHLAELLVLGKKMRDMSDIGLLSPYPLEEIKTLLK